MPKTTVQLDQVKKISGSADSRESSLFDLIDLTEDQEKKIKRILKKEIEAWENDTADLQEKLRHWYNLSEGIIEETDYPWEGAFETHIDLTGIYLKIYHSIERRSILGPENIWYAETDPEFEDSIGDHLPEIETMLNYKARAEWNIEEQISEAFKCANRDGLADLKIPYVVQTEHVEDKIIISNPDEFLEEFPSPQEAGMSRQDWEALASRVQFDATDETPLEIPVEYDRVTYDGPKAYLVERANFVTFPATAPSLESEYCRGYGDRFFIRRGEVRRRMQEDQWFKDACKEFLKKTKSKGSEASTYVTNKESAVGLGRSEKSDDWPFFELVYRMRLDDNTEKKYLFVYCKEFDLLMAAWSYIYRVDFHAQFRIDKRPNQLDGRSVTGQLEFLNEALDLMWNQRFQSREITNVPSFKAKKSAKKDFDPESDENQWRPGVVFWLEDPEAFEQFRVQPVDLGESMAEEQNLFRIAGFIMGVDASLFSGRTPAEDPQAPGNKTALLVDQGNLRMEDPLAELRYGVEKVGEICLSHLYQFGPPMIAYKTTKGQKQVTDYLKKRFLRTGLKIKMQGVTVAMNADQEFNKWMQRYMLLRNEPEISEDAVYRTDPLRRALKGGRIVNADRILPSADEIRKRQQMKQQQAVQQMAAQQEVQRRAQEQELVAAGAKNKVDMQTQAVKGVKNKLDLQKMLQEALISRNGGANGGQ